jgi:hypothetical protein
METAANPFWDLFSWTYRDGSHGTGDDLPDDEDLAVNITELVFHRNSHRCAVDGVRDHMSHPKHEIVIQSLPQNLLVLRADHCRLRNFPVLPKTIVEIYMKGNNLLHIPDLSMFQKLIVLELEDNSISAVVNPLPPTLARLNVSINAIRTFNRQLLEALEHRPDIVTDSNPYNPFPSTGTDPRHLRFGGLAPPVGALLQAGLGPRAETAKPVTVYENTQSVHASGVQSSVHRNVEWVASYRPDVPVDGSNTFLEIDVAYASTKKVSWFKRLFKSTVGTPPGSVLRKYCENSYAMHGVTLEKLVDRLWLRIKDVADEERRLELQRRLFEEVEDGNGKCTNGMMSRLSNVFVGFDDNCQIRLNVNEILGARIPATMKRIRDEMKLKEGHENTAFFLAVYKETVKDLMEVGAAQDQWRPWLEPFSESVLDDLWDSKKDWQGMTFKERPEDDVVTATITEEAGLNGYGWEVAYITDKWR